VLITANQLLSLNLSQHKLYNLRLAEGDLAFHRKSGNTADLGVAT